MSGKHGGQAPQPRQRGSHNSGFSIITTTQEKSEQRKCRKRREENLSTPRRYAGVSGPHKKPPKVTGSYFYSLKPKQCPLSP